MNTFDNLEVLKHNFGVTEADPDDALRAIEDIANAPPPPPPPPPIVSLQSAVQSIDPSEAIVARLDYMIMMQEGAQ